MSYGFEMNGTNNRPFDLKVGNHIHAIGYVTSYMEEKTVKRDIKYVVSEIYPHIFIAVDSRGRRRCFRKADYVCGIVRRA